jgi:hypothetical protein
MIRFGSSTSVIASDWAAFKSAVLELGLPMRYAEDGGTITVFAFDSPALAYTCVLWSGDVPASVADAGYPQTQNDADKTDFETNYKAGANKQIELRRESDAAQIVVIEPANRDTRLNVVGFKFTAGKNSTTDDDHSFAEQRELQGCILEVADYAPGDYAELHVVMPGSPEVVVARFAEKIYIKPSGRTEVIVPTSVPIPAGLKLRMRYVSVGVLIDPVVYYDYITWK